MINSRLCIPIPEELKQYQISSDLSNIEFYSKMTQSEFGVRVIKNSYGEIEYTAYYSDTGDLIKKIYYNGASVSHIKYYRNHKIHCDEQYNEGKIIKRINYDRYENISSTASYVYNRSDQIMSITKVLNKDKFKVDYGYDELKRVNKRTIFYNNVVINEQQYMYDILDRLVEFKDNSQHIKVHKINNKNELINYTITDKAGNKITILNKYLCSDYVGTEIDVNGHKTTVCDKNYIDNVYLKKPYTNEDDLDFVISNLYKKTEFIKTKRDCNNDIIELRINEIIHGQQKELLPISVRKLRLVSSG